MRCYLARAPKREYPPEVRLVHDFYPGPHDDPGRDREVGLNGFPGWITDERRRRSSSAVFPDPMRPPCLCHRTERSQRAKESTVKMLTSILAAGAILAFAAQAGTAANVKHAKHSTTRVGYGPYAYLGNTAQAKHSTTSVGYGPYAYLGDTAPVG